MDYRRIYCLLIYSAKANETERRRRKMLGEYFETHHILPKSLCGTNDANNLVMLTGREHFICHWLLVKMYPIGSDARLKMVNALWMMMNEGKDHRNGRYVNARAYEGLRSEWSMVVSRSMKIAQSGTKNSQHGKHWYTNLDTGESGSFFNRPSAQWILGRNWFDNVGATLYDIDTKQPYTKDAQRKSMARGKASYADYEKITYYDGYKNRYITVLRSTYETHYKHATKMWDEFHLGNYGLLREYAAELKISVNSIYNTFKRYIPRYKMYMRNHQQFSSDINLVGIYK